MLCLPFLFDSNWPTFPQVYMNGELVGGADIMLQMHQSGERRLLHTIQMMMLSQLLGDLIEELKTIGHRSLLLDKSPPE